jgi:hypothetical protein
MSQLSNLYDLSQATLYTHICLNFRNTTICPNLRQYVLIGFNLSNLYDMSQVHQLPTYTVCLNHSNLFDMCQVTPVSHMTQLQ